MRLIAPVLVHSFLFVAAACAQSGGTWEPEQLLKPNAATFSSAMQATHSILLNTGSVLCIDETQDPFSAGRIDAALVTPGAPDPVRVVADNVQLSHWRFCSGHCVLPNGWV